MPEETLSWLLYAAGRGDSVLCVLAPVCGGGRACVCQRVCVSAYEHILYKKSRIFILLLYLSRDTP